MILPNPEMIEAFERELMRREPPDYQRNLLLFEDLILHAVQLGALPPKDPLEGIDLKIERLRILNHPGPSVRPAAGTHRSDAE